MNPKVSPHTHLWELVAKTYAPPPASTNIDNSSLPPDLAEKIMLGVTTLLWGCPCGEVKKEEMLGTDEDKLEDLIEKVDKTGPQQIVRGENTYILNKWSSFSSQPGYTPIK